MKNFIGLLVLGMGIAGCAAKSEYTPADRVTNVKFYIDCCNPSLQEADKDMCRQAAKDEDHILWDTDRNSYHFVWSDCEVGKERWREWE